jgi:hypothetical protein
MARRRKRGDEARQWIITRIDALRARRAMPLPTLPQPRYQLSAEHRPKPPSIPTEPPPGVLKGEWLAAQRNVMGGSMPCLIKFPPEPVEPYPGAFTIPRFFKP